MFDTYSSSVSVYDQVQSVSRGKLDRLEEFLASAPDSSNTGGKSSQEVGETWEKTDLLTKANPGKLETGGVDYLELSLYGCWEKSAGEKLFAALEAAQQRTQETESGLPSELSPEFPELGVLGHGVGKGVRCRWAIVTKGMTIGIVNRMASSSQHPVIRVNIPSNGLMLEGHRAATENLFSLLADLGWQHEKATVSRLDFCADLIGIHCREFTEAFLEEKVIRRSIDSTIHGKGRKNSGLTLGKGMICRIYDKRAETLRNPEKLAIMIENRWGGEFPDVATRVEFQMRREQIVERVGNNELENVFSHLAELAEWATTDWLRFTAQSVDHENHNHQRATDSTIWKATQDAFSWAGEPTKCLLQPQKTVAVDTKSLVAQMAGCAAAAMARTCSGIMNEVVWIREWNAIGMRIAERGIEKVEVCRRRLAMMSAVGPPIDLDGVPF